MGMFASRLEIARRIDEDEVCPAKMMRQGQEKWSLNLELGLADGTGKPCFFPAFENPGSLRLSMCEFK